MKINQDGEVIETFRLSSMFLVVLHVILFLKVKTSNIESVNILLGMCISATILFFILDILTTSGRFRRKIQTQLTFYMVFPAVASFSLFYTNNFESSYHFLIPNIIISILYIITGIIFVITTICSEIYDKYLKKVRIECENCVRMYSVRIREYNKLRKYKYKTKKGKCMIICQHCLENDDKFLRLTLAPDFIKINYKAKLVVNVLIEKEINTKDNDSNDTVEKSITEMNNYVKNT